MRLSSSSSEGVAPLSAARESEIEPFENSVIV